MFLFGVILGFGVFVLAAGLYFQFVYRPPALEPNQAYLLKVAHLEREVKRLEGELSKAREIQKADDGQDAALLKAQLAAKEYTIEDAFRQLQAAQAEAAHLQNIIREIEEENAGLRSAIEQGIKIPGYAAFIRKRERPAVARKLHAEGWSKRQIMRHVWGYVGSCSNRQLTKALTDTSG